MIEPTTGEPIFDPSYWNDRLAKAVAREQVHYAVFEGSKEKWEAGRVRQAELLKRHVRKYDSVLDVGCGWGRLLGILPKTWEGEYLGIDFCQDFVELARKAWPAHRFWRCDFREEIPTTFATARGVEGAGRFDWAVCCSIKPMILRNAGREVWDKVESNLRAVADKILLLGYDDLDDEEGVI